VPSTSLRSKHLRTKTATAKCTLRSRATISSFFTVSNYALAGYKTLGDIIFLPMTTFYYVYILQSEADPDKHYTGKTQDLQSRLKAHNSGKVSHTSQYVPRRMINYFAFPAIEKASAFEKYLKTHSGRAFTSKHF